jgi:hypothetical protein
MTTDRELIEKAKRMIDAMRDARREMPDLAGHQTITMAIDSFGRLAALAYLGTEVLEMWTAMSQATELYPGQTVGLMGQFMRDVVPKWTEQINGETS